MLASETTGRCRSGAFAALLLAIAAVSGPNAIAGPLRVSDDRDGTVSVVDWSQGFVEVAGHATARFTGNRVQEELMAKAAARLIAQARLVELLHGLRVTGATTLRNMLVEDQRIEARFEGFVKGAITVAEEIDWRSDSAVRRGEVPYATVRLRLCLTRSDEICRPRSVALLDPIPPPKSVVREAVTPRAPAAPTVYSGLIVDLENALFLPVLFPEIVTRSGSRVYSRKQVDPAALAENGMAQYAHTVAEATRLPLVGARPLIVKAIGVTDDNRIVVSGPDSDAILSFGQGRGGFLAGARIVIALD